MHVRILRRRVTYLMSTTIRRSYMDISATVTNIQKFSVHDGPGIRSIIFTKGCPLTCMWCANPENIHFESELMFYPDKCIGCGRCVKTCPQGAIAMNTSLEGNVITFDRTKCVNCGTCTKVCFSQSRVMKGEMLPYESVLEKVNKDIPFYRNSGGGITFSGGEPLMHPDFVVGIARDCREKGLNTAVETCGFVPWENIEHVISWIDLFLFDIKFIDGRKHTEYCGHSNELILKNFKRLCEEERGRIVVRMPMIPGINDSGRDIALAGMFLRKCKEKISGIHILPYHNYGVSKYDALGIPYALSHLESPTDERMKKIKDALEGYDLQIQIGG